MPKLFNIATNKQGLIVFGGVASSDYGIVVGEAPTFEKPTRKQTIINIPGRSGAIIKQEFAWNDVTRKYKVWLAQDQNQDLVKAVEAASGWVNGQYSWVRNPIYNGYIPLEDSFEPDVYRLAYYSGGDDFTNEMMQCGEANLKFTCRPERFLKSGDIEQEFTVTGSKIYNPTEFPSKPIIRVEATGPANATVGLTGGSVSFSLEAGDSYIEFDCETLQADHGASNSKVSYTNPPTIAPGMVTLTLTGTFTKVVIKPRWYTI